MNRVCFRKHTCIEYAGIKEPATTTSDDQLVGASRPQVLDRLEAQVNQANNCDAEKTIYGGIYGGAYSSAWDGTYSRESPGGWFHYLCGV